MEIIENHPLYKKHTIDTVVSSLIDFYRSRFTILFIASFIFSIASVFYTNANIDMESLRQTSDPEEIFSIFQGMLFPLILLGLANLLFNIVLTHYIIFQPIEEDNSFIDSIRKSGKIIIPYLITMVLFIFATSIAAVIGLAVFMIGIIFTLLYLTVIYLFLLPTFLVEGSNIGNAIMRSVKMTHSKFWNNIGWTAVVVLIYAVISMILSAVITFPFAGNILKSIVDPGAAEDLISYTSNPIYLILSGSVSALLIPVLPIFSATLYFNFRAREDNGNEVTTYDNYQMD